MKPAPISVQMYSLRDECEKDFLGTIKKVADMGYKGIEPAGLWDVDPAELRKFVEDLGMVVSSNHGPWPNLENLNEVIDTAKTLGTTMAVGGCSRDDFKDLDKIKQAIETVNKMCEVINAAGLDLCIHNHFWEFDTFDGKLGYDIFMDACPNVKCELDAYWSANFGACDPVEITARYKNRTPLLHVKDGPMEQFDQDMLALGTGKLDIPAIIGAADENVLKWVIVELDRCGTDMTQAIAESYTYMITAGLAVGNR